MKQFLIILIFSLIKPVTVHGQCEYKIDTQKILNNTNLELLLNDLTKTKLTTKTNKKYIPTFIQKELNCWLKNSLYQDSFSIANPGEIYNKNDEITFGIPNRQLTFLGVSKKLILLTYHRGGEIGAGTNIIMIIKFTNSKIIDFWCCRTSKLRTKEKILSWLKKYKADTQSSVDI